MLLRNHRGPDFWISKHRQRGSLGISYLATITTRDANRFIRNQSLVQVDSEVVEI
jgi:hypothetical protein